MDTIRIKWRVIRVNVELCNKRRTRCGVDTIRIKGH